MVQRLLVVFSFCVLFAQSGAAAPSPASLDVQGWLDRPGVKLLAVEFYATWCKPCMEAVPKWKSLHKRYADEGLRLIVVATRDPRGQCQNPGWNPDQVICDTDGRIADALNVGDSLPSAFLWSWRGKLLVRGGHVAEVTEAVKAELQALPRVMIEPPENSEVPRTKRALRSLRGLSTLVESELVREDKLIVIAGKKAAKAIAKARRQARDPSFSVGSRCKLGGGLAPNSMLRLDLPDVSGTPHLSLQLFDLESGCVSASAFARFNPKRPKVSVAAAINELLDGLSSEAELPAGLVVAPTPPPSLPPAAEAPPAAPQRDAAAIEGETGRLNVQSRPAGLKVFLGDTELGLTPIRDHLLKAGRHRIRVEGKCGERRDEVVELESGGERSLDFVFPEQRVSLSVEVIDRKASRLAATVLIDGQVVGPSPGPFTTSTCSKTLEVRHATKGRIIRDLNLAPGSAHTVSVTFANSQDFIWALERDFRQGLWAPPEQIKAAYKAACDDGDFIACTQAWHRSKGADRGVASAQMFMPCGFKHPASCLGLGWMASQGLWSDQPKRNTEWGIQKKAGNVAMSVGNNPTAGYNYLATACEAKLQRACVELGRLHANGVGTSRDDARACELFHGACTLGESRGCTELAVMKRLGRGAAQDLPGAVQLARKACTRGDMHGCRELGHLYERGQGVERDEARALSHYEQSCDGGHMEGCYRSGVMYQNGLGTTQDAPRAAALFARSCEGGHVPACDHK